MGDIGSIFGNLFSGGTTGAGGGPLGDLLGLGSGSSDPFGGGSTGGDLTSMLFGGGDGSSFGDPTGSLGAELATSGGNSQFGQPMTTPFPDQTQQPGLSQGDAIMSGGYDHQPTDTTPPLTEQQTQAALQPGGGPGDVGGPTSFQPQQPQPLGGRTPGGSDPAPTAGGISWGDAARRAANFYGGGAVSGQPQVALQAQPGGGYQPAAPQSHITDVASLPGMSPTPASVRVPAAATDPSAGEVTAEGTQGPDPTAAPAAGGGAGAGKAGDIGKVAGGADLPEGGTPYYGPSPPYAGYGDEQQAGGGQQGGQGGQGGGQQQGGQGQQGAGNIVSDLQRYAQSRNPQDLMKVVQDFIAMMTGQGGGMQGLAGGAGGIPPNPNAPWLARGQRAPQGTDPNQFPVAPGYAYNPQTGQYTPTGGGQGGGGGNTIEQPSNASTPTTPSNFNSELAGVPGPIGNAEVVPGDKAGQIGQDVNAGSNVGTGGRGINVTTTLNPQTGLPNPENREAVMQAGGGGQTVNSMPGLSGQNLQQIRSAPPQSISQNFGQPVSGTLRQDRAQLVQEVNGNPRLKDRVFRLAYNEQGGNPQGVQAVMESMVNRARVRGTGMAQQARWHRTEGGYYQEGSGYRGPVPARLMPMLEQAWRNVVNGSNISNYATDNSSGALASRERATGRFGYRSGYTGETFFRPGSAEPGLVPRYFNWLQSMQGTQMAAQ